MVWTFEDRPDNYVVQAPTVQRWPAWTSSAEPGGRAELVREIQLLAQDGEAVGDGWQAARDLRTDRPFTGSQPGVRLGLRVA